VIVYLDTSAVVPILIAEPSSEMCRRIWDGADRRVSSQLAYVEVAAALAMAERRGRLTAEQHDQAWANFVALWPDIDVVDLTDELAARAADLTRPRALRGYDAVHCASVVMINDADVIAASGDAQLLTAWQDLGVTTLDTHQDFSSPPGGQTRRH